MKDNKLIKSGVSGVVDGENQSVGDDELELINRFTRRNLAKNEVYAFSVVLCDNDVDRDGERFTTDSLYELEKLFVGKTGIIDHNPSAKNQTARIFSCKVEKIDGQKTALGDDYYRLKARAYLPVCESNRDIILAIDSGIIKEVSVGCAVGRVVCNVCGEDISMCTHKKGEVYGSKLCCGELVNPYDAYEWSFVAVPSQKRAGITKGHKFFGKENDMEKILKAIENKKAFTLDESDSRKLCEYIDGLKKSAKDGVLYRESLTRDVVGLAAFVQPDISGETMESVAKSMTIEQLREFKSALKRKRKQLLSLFRSFTASRIREITPWKTVSSVFNGGIIMNVNFNGFGENAATFIADKTITEAGVPVKIKDNGTVAKCDASENFCGVCVSVRGGYAVVQLSGYVKVKSDKKIAVGYKKLSATAVGGVSVTTTGREYLVLDSTDTSVGFIL